MILTIFVVWLACAALAVVFVYCCARVSEHEDGEFAAEAPTRLTAVTPANLA